MARRWQLSLWVLVGLVLAVVALWDNATVSAVAGRVAERTEAVAAVERHDPDIPPPANLAYDELERAGVDEPEGANLLRPTTTTTRPPTTRPPTTRSPTTRPSTTSEQAPDDAEDPDSTTTEPTGDDGAPGTSTPGGGEQETTGFYEDFAAGALAAESWAVEHTADLDGWVLLRRSAVAVVADPSAAGGSVLEITAAMGSGDEAGQMVSGALALLGQERTYGRYTFRARIDADPDGVTSGVLQLREVGPEEPERAVIDVMATGANPSSRAPVESILYPFDGDAAAPVEVSHRSATGPVSAAEWHIYSLDWNARRLTVAVDGGEPVTLSNDATLVPHGRLSLAITLDVIDPASDPGVRPTRTGDVRLQVDWIRIEDPDS